MATDADLGAGVSIRDFTANAADTDTYQVTLNDGEIYDFWVVPNGGGNPFDDPALDLSQGAQVAFDDDSAEGFGATFLYGATTVGDFTLTVTSTVADFGNYVLSVTNKSRIDDVSDHLFGVVNGPDASVTGIGTNAVLAEEDIVSSELIDRPGLADSDADVWAVFLTEGQFYSFTVEGATSGIAGGTTNANLRLLDGEGVDTGLVAVVNGSDETLPATQVASGQGGWYFLEVTGTPGNYRLFFDDATSGAPITFDVPGGITGPFPLNGSDELDNTQAGNDLFGNSLATLDNPFNLPLGDTIQGNIETSGDADWYAINLVAGFTYRFIGEGGTLGNVTVQVRDAAGSAQAGGSASGAEPQQVDFTATTSGLYYIDIHGQGAGDTGSFALSSQLLSTGVATPPVHDITDLGDDNTKQYVGSDQADSLTSGDTSDQLLGGGGDDTLHGGLGNDSIGGGDGESGGGGNDSLFGEAGQDFINGDDGNDTIDGGADGDTIFGGPGIDSLLGSGGDDSIFGGADDTARGGEDNDTIIGGGNGLLDGGNGNDSLFANGQDTALGGEGNDTIDGDGGGSNLLDGGNGNDTFIVEPGDTVIAGAGVDHITSFIAWTLDGDEENLTLLGGGSFNGAGNGGANVIFGNDGNNQLLGLAGSDTVNGGAGADTLIGGFGKDLNTGGGGLDVIRFNALGESGTTFATRDAISTFAHGDKIDLSAIDANAKVAGNQAFTFSTAQALTGASGLLIAQQVATNSFLILADVNGDHAADFSLNVYTSPGFGSFQSWDFIP